MKAFKYLWWYLWLRRPKVHVVCGFCDHSEAKVRVVEVGIFSWYACFKCYYTKRYKKKA